MHAYVQLILLTFQSMRIVATSYGTASEYHFILSQCASLISEHMFYLSQVFSNIQCFTLDPSLCLLMIHVHVPCNEDDLTYLNYLNCDVQ